MDTEHRCNCLSHNQFKEELGANWQVYPPEPKHYQQCIRGTLQLEISQSTWNKHITKTNVMKIEWSKNVGHLSPKQFKEESYTG